MICTQQYVVSMDSVSGDLPEYPGIRHMNLREFFNMGFCRCAVILTSKLG